MHAASKCTICSLIIFFQANSSLSDMMLQTQPLSAAVLLLLMLSVAAGPMFTAGQAAGDINALVDLLKKTFSTEGADQMVVQGDLPLPRMPPNSAAGWSMCGYTCMLNFETSVRTGNQTAGVMDVDIVCVCACTLRRVDAVQLLSVPGICMYNASTALPLLLRLPQVQAAPRSDKWDDGVAVPQPAQVRL